jgi:hypothetical protein
VGAAEDLDGPRHRARRPLNWRYADAHDSSYRLYECRERSTGKLRGLSVYTQCDFLFPRAAFLVDWLLPVDDDDAMVAMVASAEACAVSAQPFQLLAIERRHPHRRVQREPVHVHAQRTLHERLGAAAATYPLVPFAAALAERGTPLDRRGPEFPPQPRIHRRRIVGW